MRTRTFKSGVFTEDGTIPDMARNIEAHAWILNQLQVGDEILVPASMVDNPLIKGGKSLVLSVKRNTNQ